MSQRFYPETMPVLASYWLKTVCHGGHNRAWWVDLNRQIKGVLKGEHLDARSCGTLVSIQNWIERSVLLAGNVPEARQGIAPPFRDNPPRETLATYVSRLLNEWLSAEIASLLVEHSELPVDPEEGIPALARARALERVLIRERLSPEVLEQLLQPELLSPKSIYPADAEILRDVIAALLGRVWAPRFPGCQRWFSVWPRIRPFPRAIRKQLPVHS
jgi:hypothetical protein